ncbi:vacuolar fusion protein ccz1 [Dinochytrium kinnereticum]|nr:vacuolar fusion protein ccz1 [Dinochytrium kinnereticum]
MSTVMEVHPPELSHFAVFNPSWGPKEETADQQIAFYHPLYTSSDEMMRQVGLAQALVNFTSIFGPSRPCDAVVTEKHRVALLEAEPGFWLSLKVKFGYTVRTNKDGLRQIEYSRTIGETALRYLDRLNFENLDVIENLGGITYLTLQQPGFLKLISFINDLEQKFPMVTGVCILWRHNVVYSGLPSVHDLRLFFDYITNPETGKVDDFIVNQIKPKGEAVISTRRMNLMPPTVSERDPQLPSTTSTSTNQSSGMSPFFYKRPAPVPPPFSGFIIGPEDPDSPGLLSTQEEQEAWGAKTLFVGKDRREYKTLVYQFEEDTTVAFFCEAEGNNGLSLLNKPEFYISLRSILHSRLPTLVQSFGETWLKSKKALESQENPYRYLFFNGISLAVRTTIGATKSTVITSDVIQSITDLHSEMESSFFFVPLLKVKLEGSGDEDFG